LFHSMAAPVFLRKIIIMLVQIFLFADVSAAAA
jgi:hypothetical protein